jgi:hypothetical protein
LVLIQVVHFPLSSSDRFDGQISNGFLIGWSYRPFFFPKHILNHCACDPSSPNFQHIRGVRLGPIKGTKLNILHFVKESTKHARLGQVYIAYVFSSLENSIKAWKYDKFSQIKL